MKPCPRCQQFADDYSSFCSRCGQDLRTETRPGTPPPIHTYTDRTDNPFDAYGPEENAVAWQPCLPYCWGALVYSTSIWAKPRQEYCQ